ncbi:hypothetical protein KDH_71100 [Dictyobacter sp. S3.2.2.5]|uniref:Uncharacterized protein n=1 Tax=Dictyobacter halimunensis TaxID=3026934 RepID=A0ABQ6G652_9CHLR|nr:hypothetical protein KDH_71100 [Dictyobacter sp. S3.2.2.5]
MKRSYFIVAMTLALAFAAMSGLMSSFGSASAATAGDVLHSIHSMKVKPSCHNCAGTTSNLSYHGGTGGYGVETGADKVYLIYWGSQWNNNDPSGEAAIQQKFFNGVGGSKWNNSVTQYCQGVATGTVTCGSSGTHATNPAGVEAGVWYDNSSTAPSRPSQSQLASEAVKAAAHFGNTSASSNTTVQYVINTATHNSASGFGTQYCAWHSSTSSSYGNIAYTNMPYITDAGSSCGANFVNAGSAGLTDGITIVGGHEFAETESDIYPSTGWVDSSGSENGDKCAWISSGQGASANVSLSTGTFPVQSLWSNAFNSNTGGCVLSY